MEESITMTHRKEMLVQHLNQDLDDLEVRNPKKAEMIENKLRRLQIEASFYVSQSPPGTRSMERMR